MLENLNLMLDTQEVYLRSHKYVVFISTCWESKKITVNRYILPAIVRMWQVATAKCERMPYSKLGNAHQWWQQQLGERGISLFFLFTI